MASAPTGSVTPSTVPLGDTVTFNGSGFQPDHVVWAQLILNNTPIAQTRFGTDADGNLTFDWGTGGTSASPGPSALAVYRHQDQNGLLCSAPFTTT